MKNKAIRIGIYETNSSSSHSFTMGPEGRLANGIRLKKDGTLELSLGEWLKTSPKTNNAKSKLSYLICFVWTRTYYSNQSAFDKYFQAIKMVVLDFTGATDLKITNKIKLTGREAEAVVDHQSLDMIDSRDFTNPTFIKEFVFNPDTWLYTTWDSMTVGKDFYEKTPDTRVLYTLRYDLPDKTRVDIPVMFGGNQDLYSVTFHGLVKYIYEGIIKEKPGGFYWEGYHKLEPTIILPGDDKK